MRIGTIGTGAIVADMVTNMQRTDNCIVEAVYSRREETARAFADKFGVSKIYTNLDAMCQDDDIDCIYVASPNSLHYEQAKKALNYGKHVLLEKPFTVKLTEAKELVTLAKEKHLMLFEAITLVHHPNFVRLKEHLPLIGNLQMILATFCQYSRKYDAFLNGELPNVFNPAFAGGSLMDINFYNLYFVNELLGKPEKLHYYAAKADNGIDTHGVLIMQYPNNVVCTCTGSKASASANGIQLIGDKGYITVGPMASFLQELRVVRKGEPDIFYHVEENAWYHEVQSIMKYMNAKDYDFCYQRLEKTLEVVEILENARKSAGMSF